MFAARRVAVYRSALLPPSETFVRAQASALRRWKPVLVGDVRVRPSLPLTGLSTITASRDDGPIVRRVQRADTWLERRIGLSLATSLALLRARASIVHAHFGTDGARVWPAARVLGLPLVVTLHGFDIMIHEHHWPLLPSWRHHRYPGDLRALAREPRVRFVAVSEGIRRRAIALGIAPDSVETVHIGVDTSLFRPSGAPLRERAREVLFVGRLVEKKGTAHLIEAFARVHAALPDARLVIAGDGPLRTALQDASAQRALPIRWLGETSVEGVRAQLARARVLCLPSVIASSGDSEGLPIVLLEAQASGLPVVTSADGVAGEGMLHGETGLAFAAGDVAALATQLITLLSDDTLCTRMGERARVFACTRFELAACTEKLEAVYDRALADGR
jgi:glycosyltransferase involved in cell wall biosynthesis